MTLAKSLQEELYQLDIKGILKGMDVKWVTTNRLNELGGDEVGNVR